MTYSIDIDENWDMLEEPSTVADPLLECLHIVTRYYGNPFSHESLRAGLPLENGKFTAEIFMRSAERAGLVAKVHARKIADLSSLVTPAVLLLKKKRACVLIDIDQEEGLSLIHI